MSPKAQYIRRQIRELQRELEHLGEDGRKQYWRDRYAMNREKFKAAALARYYAKKQRRENVQRTTETLFT